MAYGPGPAGTVSPGFGGTTGADTITLKPADANGTLDVKSGTTDLANFKPIGHIIVYGQAADDTIKLQTASINGATVYVSTPAFLFGDGGNDTLNTAGSTANNVLEGGAGNDTLQAGSSRDLLVGGTGADVLHSDGGNDILIGGTGDDVLIGGSGRDLLIGGTGNDLILGGTGQDIVIAGKTNYDHSDLALRSLLSEWASGDSFTVRVSNLQGLTHTGADLNGAYYLNTSTVQDDHSVDVLVGGSGRDWFFADSTGQTGPRDVVLDLHVGDIVTNV